MLPLPGLRIDSVHWKVFFKSTIMYMFLFLMSLLTKSHRFYPLATLTLLLHILNIDSIDDRVCINCNGAWLVFLVCICRLCCH